MLKDFAQQDYTSLADHAHWLKGAGGTVGFHVFTEPAARLESLANSGSTERIATTLRELIELAEAIRLDEHAEAETALGEIAESARENGDLEHEAETEERPQLLCSTDG
jgi:HPt (histidine-containing phosphotransfer) domain-containing protein